MKKMIKLGILSAVSIATILAPLDTTLADIKLSYGEDIVTKTMKDMEKRIDNQMRSTERRINNQTKNMDSKFSSHFDSFHSSDHRPYHHVDRKKREQKHHHVERKTYRRVEHKTITHRHIYEHNVNRNNSGDALAAGIIGLAAGAVLGNVLKQPKQPQIVYQAVPQNQIIYQEVPQVVYQQVPQNQIIYEAQSTTVYQPLHQPWTRNWLQYCQKRYRSFNPRTGTFRGYDGLDHFCYAPVN
ncbi:BA14K family protein [Bartonella acomydis]|uniref:Lectin-like protein BA14k n=1 Tax=Bartonella acomydis TaxID=686234 RepID=A0ABP9MJ94_9HYPH